MRPDAVRGVGTVVRSWKAHHRARLYTKAYRSFASTSKQHQSGPSVQAAPAGGSGSSSNGSSSSASTSKPTTSASTSSSATPPASASSAAKPKGPPSVARRRNTDLALIISGGLGLSALLFYNIRTREPSTSASLSTLSPSSKSFTLPIQTSSGLQLRTIQMLAPAKVSELLTANERTYSVTRPGNPLYRYDINSVASNPTCEDAQSFTIFEHEGTDYILASVFDGHSGFWTSRLMAENLEKYIARELFEVLRGGYKSLNVNGDSWWNWLWQTGTKKPEMPTAIASQERQAQASVSTDIKPTLLPQALRTAFNLADRDLIQPPMDYLKSLEAGSKGSPLQLTEEQRRHGLGLLQPALSGSCAISALLDTSSSNLYVALAGDSRAVMGTFDPDTKKWKVEVLSEDQTGRNLKEVERLKKEHPKNEEETVIMRGRVLGGLEPTRSFGDGKYKFPLTMQEKLIAAFKPSTSRTAPPSLYKTPPYVTADPVVSVTSLASPAPSSADAATVPVPTQHGNTTPLAPASDTANSPASTATSVGKRFIVLATDGLYDCLSSEEVVALVAGHLDGLKGDKTRSEVLGRLEESEAVRAASLASPHKPKEDKEKGKRFTFEDQNLGTHLVRNALGGAQREHVSALLSIPAPYSRRYRDDITVNVLLLGDGTASPEAGSSDEKALPGVTRVYTQPARAKL